MRHDPLYLWVLGASLCPIKCLSFLLFAFLFFFLLFSSCFFFFCPADHIPDWQPGKFMVVVEAQLINRLI